MALDPSNLADKIDPELKEFIVNEQIKTQIRAQIRKLNNICFDKCIEKPGNSPDDNQQTFHLIRLPKETCERAASGHVGTLATDSSDGLLVFQDNESSKLYKIVSNKIEPSKLAVSAGDKGGHDLLKISLNREEAVHLGKVDVSTLLCVPKDCV